MLIFKLLRPAEWHDFERRGQTEGAPVDRADAFIHFSTAAQLGETLVRHFGAESALWLVAVEAGGLDGLRWEPARGGALFPHLFRSLTRRDVVWGRPIGREGGAWRLPDLSA